MADAPKIIIDSDWKQQAQAEKEKLAAKEQAKQAQKQEAAAGGMGEDDPNRPIDFHDIVRSFASQALMYLGAFPDETGRAVVAPEMAKAYIDMLGVLQDKTKGNLTKEEESSLAGVLTELRLNFVEISKAVSKAIAEGKIKPGGGMGGPGMGGGLAGPGMGGPGGPGPNLRMP